MIADRVKETTTTTGTGTVNLVGAATAFQTFVAGIGDGNTCYYCIELLSLGEWEVGIGTVTDASPDTLSRDTVLQSSNADAAVDFSGGTKDVFVVHPAEKTLYRDANGDVVVGIADGDKLVMGGAGATDFTQQWDGSDLVFTITAGQFRFVGGNVELEDTVDANAGVIMKGADRFIHNFHHPTGGGAVPTGQNTFIGVGAGNFTLGSTATQTYHASTNVAVGDAALDALTTGYQNMAVGQATLGACDTGHANVGVGISCLQNVTSASNNVGIGFATLQNATGGANVALGSLALQRLTSGVDNVGVGFHAGQFIADGSTPNQTTNNSVYLGRDTKASADGADNEIVIGYNAIGRGANTAVIGGSTLTKMFLPGEVQVESESTHGGLILKTYAASSGTLTNDHTITIQVNVPAGAKILGAQLHVKTALAGGETWNAQYVTGATQSIGTNQAVAQNTNLSTIFDVNTDTDIASGEVDITLQRNSNPGVDAFTAQGEIEAVVYALLFDTWDNE